MAFAEHVMMKKTPSYTGPLPYPPRFIVGVPQQKVVSREEILDITVTVDARPPVSHFVWYINGFEVSDDTHIIF